MNSTYRVQIKSVMDLLRACRADTELAAIRKREINVAAILDFYDMSPDVATKNHPDQQDQLVHQEFVELAIHFSFNSLKQKTKFALDSLMKTEKRWIDIENNIKLNGVENSCLDIMTFEKTITEFLNWIDRYIPFLPDCLPDDNGSRSGNIICTYFGEWFQCGRSYRLIVIEHSRVLHSIKLSIPSSEFNRRYPVNPIILQNAETKTLLQVLICDICTEACLCRVVCPTCKNKTLCYPCFRQTAWSQQHNDFQVFSQLRSVYCPFCKSLMDDTIKTADIQLNTPIIRCQTQSSSLHTDLISASQSPKRRKI